ncbi:MAG TPA: hypothetical protein VIN76_06120 [Parasphingorhabdus sp.]
MLYQLSYTPAQANQIFLIKANARALAPCAIEGKRHSALRPRNSPFDILPPPDMVNIDPTSVNQAKEGTVYPAVAKHIRRSVRRSL